MKLFSISTRFILIFSKLNWKLICSLLLQCLFLDCFLFCNPQFMPVYVFNLFPIYSGFCDMLSVMFLFLYSVTIHFVFANLCKCPWVCERIHYKCTSLLLCVNKKKQALLISRFLWLLCLLCLIECWISYRFSRISSYSWRTKSQRMTSLTASM